MEGVTRASTCIRLSTPLRFKALTCLNRLFGLQQQIAWSRNDVQV